MVAARNGYTATIVPLYPRATDLADEVANHPSLAAIPAAQFAAALRQARARLAGVTAFPGAAQPAFAAFQADSETVLGDLADQASARAAAANGAVPGTAARYKAVADLYALAHQIGVLGVGLGLLPGAAPSAASTGAGG